jgi:hypothetical protein
MSPVEGAEHFDPATADVRECGLELLALSTVYERPVVGDEAGVETLAMIGLVARMRRLLRASYRLADAGEIRDDIVGKQRSRVTDSR